MHGRWTGNSHEQQIETLLLSLWNTLRTGEVTEPEALLQDHLRHLSCFSIKAIAMTVEKLKGGEMEGASRQWAPTLPELKQYVRAEQARLDALHRPKALPYAPVHKEFQRHNERQRRETKELERQGWKKLADNIGQEEFNTQAKRRRLPVGARWFWSLEEVWVKPLEGMN